ncbi:hypothetical protein K435DRAFT_858648 [Dendrothele bispora CBS 962.96]|uniref:Clathrin/coatomer adaptor adaptin-like N-terminal domain-containing protein n=1 Tax=Dendrothele bispora (strain CBS 962.96) TaxID=1314807 RepID=A0A4S8M3Q2_DENBC|nr:hypothetical protein K435DRAFT_858648 [Dendrothele bispora CBS 962.96]
MSAEYLNTLTENASRLGMRLQESFSERTRDLALTRSNASAYLDSADDKTKNIRKQLDSNSDREKLDAMKRLIALISKGRNVSEYFAQVVKNVASQNLEIRKLVYIYLLRYAEQEPDLALLSINTFQKDLTDSNPLIRAMALRVLGGIRVPMIGNIVVLAIKKCAADVSPYVRKVAALAIPKCYELDNTHLPSLIEVITTLLQDRSPLSIGSVAVAFDAVCPTRLDLIHQRYRRLCKVLLDVDEWGQVELLNLLLRYARTMLPRPIAKPDGDEIDPDLKLLLDSSAPLFQSRNPAVVLAATRVFWYAGLPSMYPKFVGPLLRLLHTSKETERVVLSYLLLITRSETTLFALHYKQFFLFADDTRHVKTQKIKLLLRLLTFDNHQAILRELIDYADDIDDQVVADSIHAIGRCANIVPESTQQCLTALVAMIKSNSGSPASSAFFCFLAKSVYLDIMVSNAVLVVKNLVQAQLSQSQFTNHATSSSSISIISHLASKIDTIRHPAARACVIWLVGQYCNISSSNPNGTSVVGTGGSETPLADWAPDVLRKSAKSFIQEDTIVKLQIITLAAKLLIMAPPSSPYIKTLELLTSYVFSLARYDSNSDVRDRARMIASLLVGVFPSSLSLSSEVGDDNEYQTTDAAGERKGVVLRREQVKLVLFGGKAQAVDLDQDKDDQSQNASSSSILLGSLSVLTGKPSLTDQILPDWLERGVEPSLRDSPDEKPVMVVPTAISSASVSGHGAGRGGGARRGGFGNRPDVLAPPGTMMGAGGGGGAGVSVAQKANGWTDLDKFYEEDSSESGSEEEEEGNEREKGEEEEESGEEEEEEDGEESGEEDEEDDEDEETSSNEEDGAGRDGHDEIQPAPAQSSTASSPTQDVYGDNVWNAS